MNASQLYKKEFAFDNLFSIYINDIQKNASIGSDGNNRKRFENVLSQELTIIERKLKLKSYSFSPYKCICILRGIHKPPRVVEKPTIRDKIVLRAIHNVLKNIYNEDLLKRTLHSQVKSIINEITSGDYDYLLRFDVTNFFPSIVHEKLLSMIKKKVRKKELLFLISAAIKNINDIEKSSGKVERDIGIPQGLSISNVLSNIYLFGIDSKYENNENIKYFRFVDDILILCAENQAEELKEVIFKDFDKIGLKLHDEDNNKNYCQPINKAFDFLGYNFNDRKISVRKQSLNNIRDSIIKILTYFKYRKNLNIELLEFKMNLRISGCIIDNNKYGWMFYFSQITDESILHSLDHFISKQLKRYDMNNIRIKKFVKVWMEINKNINNTSYIPKFSYYSKEQKEKIVGLYKIRFDSDDIDNIFDEIISKEIRNLEKDMVGMSG